MTSTEKILDQTKLLERLMGDRDFAKILLQAFWQDVPPKIEAFANAIACQDKATAKRLVHSIKGAAANISADYLRTKAQVVEALMHQENFDEIELAINELRAACAELKEHIDAFIMLDAEP